MPGRKNLPTEIKKAKGTLRKHRVKNVMTPEKIERLPPPPKYLSKIARKIYFAKGKELLSLKILTPFDIEMFLAYCHETGRYFETSEQIQTHQGTPTDLKILLRQNEAAFLRMKVLSSEFGLTPAARQKIERPDQGNPIDDEFENL